ncbi:MAG: hypothetical protein Q8S21_06475 [Candidatus Paracaedibacteraceae bacterium]|nr:hypothetical protein [Candidatus Paracaedibacteraceae bacterium]
MFGFLSTKALSNESVTINVSSAAVVTTPLLQDAFGQGGFPISITGAGIFGVTGISTHTGVTTIGGALGSGLGGNMLVTGRVGSANKAFTVAPTGTLMGSGTVVGTVINAGNLSPSNNRAIPNDTGPPLKPGTILTITGSYSQAADAFLKLFSTPSACDRLAVSDIAMCDGTLVINPVGNYPSAGTTFRIMTWGSSTGTFPNVINGSNIPVSLVTTIDDFGMSVKISGASTIVTSSGVAASSLTDATGEVAVSDGATVSNTSGSQTVSAIVSIAGTSTLSTSVGAATVLTGPIMSPIGTRLNLGGGGTINFSGDNNALLGDIAVSGSIVNVSSSLGSGGLELANTTLNITSGATLNNTVTTDAGTIIALKPLGIDAPVVVSGSLSGQGAISIDGGGIAIFNKPNANLSGPIQLSSSTAQIADGSNLGTGNISLEGASPTIVLGNVTLSNPISVNAAATFRSNSIGGFAGPITGRYDLTFDGTGTTKLTGNSTNYSNQLKITGGTVAVDANFENAAINVSDGATFSGTGKVGDVTLSSGARVIAGESSLSNLYAHSWQNDNAIYDVYINSMGESNTIVVSGDSSLNAPTFNILMDANNRFEGVIDYNVLQAGGALSVTGPVTINWVNPNPSGVDPITFTMGTLQKTISGITTNYLVLRATLAREVRTSSAAQKKEDVNDAVIYSGTLAPISPLIADVVPVKASNAAPVAEQDELTSIVFGTSSSTNDPSALATADSFHFKRFSNSVAKPVSGKRGITEALLTALSKSGPQSYKVNETRLWVTPYVNRTRVKQTNSDVGSQGWSGGSLLGIERRDKKNTWSLGILGGLMGSRSHALGTPNTFSKTTGIILGGFNSYKYTTYKDKGNFGHEILASRTFTSVDAQRYDLDSTKNTPFFALSAYKITTDVGNGQLNYLFDIIKESMSCRLSTGLTYIRTKYGAYTERNAGANGLIQSARSHKSVEFYNGIGFRKIQNTKRFILRATAVYEYGYQVSSSGSVAKTTTQSYSPTTFTAPPGPRQNKHYLQLSGSCLDRETGLKFILSYSGVSYKNVKSHTAMFKVEHRF